MSGRMRAAYERSQFNKFLGLIKKVSPILFHALLPPCRQSDSTNYSALKFLTGFATAAFIDW